MFDIYNLLIGVGLIILGMLIGIPNIKERLDGNTDKYGAYSKVIFGAIGLIIVGLVMVIKEVF